MICLRVVCVSVPLYVLACVGTIAPLYWNELVWLIIIFDAFCTFISAIGHHVARPIVLCLFQVHGHLYVSIELLTQSVLIMWYMNQTKPPKFYQKINDIFHLNVCVEMFVQEHIHTRAHTFLFFLLSNNKNFQYFWSFTLFWSMLLLEQILCTCRLLHELFVIF